MRILDVESSASCSARRWAFALATVALAAVSGEAAAQQPPAATADTTHAFALEEPVVAADRAESDLGSSIAAVTRVSAQRLAWLPATNLADVLRLVPGFALVDLDGLGQDPQMMVRGFHGRGAADYVTVLLDGRPLNSLHSGVMLWDAVPPVALSSIEVVRGPSSALYGDGAVGGVINLVTADDAPEQGVWDFGAGAPFSVRGAVRTVGDIAFMPVTFFAGVRRVSGYRDNATRTVGNAGGTIDLVSGPDRSLSLSTHGMWLDAEIPGPRPADEIDANPEPIEIFYSYDGAFTWLGRADLEGSVALSAGSRLSGVLSTELRRSTEIRTVQPALDQGDTQERSLDAERLFGTVELEYADLGLPWSDRLIVGVDASTGRLGAEHLDVVSGGAVTYAFSEPSRPLVASGRGTRSTAAGFVQYELRPAEALRISLGGRFDMLGDSFEPGEPSPDVETTADNTAFSPRAGLNFRWIESSRQKGHVYVAGSRTFKAPTLDQLFDQRKLPLFPNVDEPISSALLEPERGTSLEVGAYHEAVLSPGSWTGRASLALYRIDMEDEIALDVGTFRYGNIGESRHRGVEAGVGFAGPSALTLVANYALQDVTARSGANDGNALKAVPRHTLSAGLSRSLVRNVDVGVFLTRHGDAWLDDENTARLPGFTRVDARASVSASDVELSLKVLNLFDASYSTTGFLDPGGTGTALLFPAAGQVFELGVRIGA